MNNKRNKEYYARLEARVDKLEQKVDTLNAELFKLHGQLELLSPSLVNNRQQAKPAEPAVVMNHSMVDFTPKHKVASKSKRRATERQVVDFPCYKAVKMAMQKAFGSDKVFEYNAPKIAKFLHENGYVTNYKVNTICWCIVQMKKNNDLEVVQHTTDPFRSIVRVKQTA